MQVRIAVSPHTPDDELRDTLVPVNERWSVDEVLSAARYYADTSGRRVSIEYALIRDINDQPWRAQLLAKVLRKHRRRLPRLLRGDGRTGRGDHVECSRFYGHGFMSRFD
jgi:23S rRNA (adenine2503-C2)-methyltransferase